MTTTDPQEPTHKTLQLPLAYEFGLYWRGSMILSLCLGAMLFFIGVAVYAVKHPPAPTPEEPASVTVTNPVPAPAAPSARRQEYIDPTGYYRVELPSGYRLTDKTSGNRSKRNFEYGDDLSLWILAHPMNKDWDPAGEMVKKTDAINRGQAGFSAPVKVAMKQLIEIGGTQGYEFTLGAEDDRAFKAHTIASVGQGNAFSIAVTCTDLRQEPLYHQLVSAIKDTFQATKQAPPDPLSTGTAPTKSKPAPNLRRPEPAAASPALTINGVLKRGDSRLALINNNIYGEGDIVTVREGGRELRFRVTRIGEEKNQVELEPLNGP